jgi:adenylosuccinate lyase
LLLDLVEAGILREDAYRMVQRHAMHAWKEGLNFRELVFNDPEISSRVSRQKLEHAFNLDRQLRNVDKIFRRVFGKAAAASTGKNGTRRKNSKKQPAERGRKRKN